MLAASEEEGQQGGLDQVAAHCHTVCKGLGTTVRVLGCGISVRDSRNPNVRQLKDH